MQIQGEPASFPLLDGKLRLYRRKESPHWQCAAYLASKNWRATTREADFARARDVAEDWYVNPPNDVGAEIAKQLHDYVVFMANTGLQPDEASHLEFRDIAIDDEETDEPILVLDVRGKWGVGYCKSMPSAVRVFDRLLKRASQAGESKPLPTDRVFPPRSPRALQSDTRRARPQT